MSEVTLGDISIVIAIMTAMVLITYWELQIVNKLNEISGLLSQFISKGEKT